MLKLQQLLNSTCTNVIRAVAKFVYKAFNDLWFYVIHVCRFCTFWYPVAILCNCVRHADQMFLSRMTFVRARGPKTIIKSLNPWILNFHSIAQRKTWWGSSLIRAVYDECKYSDTFWLNDRIHLFVHYTISLSSLCKLIWRHWTYEMPVRYSLSSVLVR